MKNLILLLSAFALPSSSAHAGNCKVLDGTPSEESAQVFKVLEKHGYTKSADGDSYYFVSSASGPLGKSLLLESEVSFYDPDTQSSIYVTGQTLDPVIGLALNICGDHCIDRRASRALAKALRELDQQLKDCQYKP